mmetsp:Transcript_21789/g.58701  ORF Transcript_21789/g.58701 Transcript_21789/m.58701 type:complete len:304 (-) Transcript_21789:4137-5048(-)
MVLKSAASWGASCKPPAPCGTTPPWIMRDATCTGASGAPEIARASRAHVSLSESMDTLAARAACWRRALSMLPGLRSSDSVRGEDMSVPDSTRSHQPARPTTREAAARIHRPGSLGPSQRSDHALGTVEARRVAPSACTVAVRSSAPRTTRAMDESVASTTRTSAAAFLSSSATNRFTGVSKRPLAWRPAASPASLRSSWLRRSFCQRLRRGDSSAAQRSRSKEAVASAGVERVRMLSDTCAAVRVATARSALSARPKSWGESVLGSEAMARSKSLKDALWGTPRRPPSLPFTPRPASRSAVK